jgi:pimeloyl-ACP methyl ester carboxylesterase
MLLRSTIFAAAVATAVLSGQSAGAPATLVTSTDYGTTASAMTMAGYGSMTTAGRRFLAFDPSGDGRVVEALGDVSTADRIVVLVPGNDVTLRTFDEKLASQARALYDALGHHDRVAVVAWLGYDPPEGIWPDALREQRADDGAVALREFIETLPGQGSIVLVGHSYGSVVAALATPELPSRVTDLVALASPGMGASRVRGLHTHARVWTATAPTDWIRRIPGIRLIGLGHGPVPTDAQHLPVDGVYGHDGYLVPGSATLKAIADLALQN